MSGSNQSRRDLTFFLISPFTQLVKGSRDRTLETKRIFQSKSNEDDEWGVSHEQTFHFTTPLLASLLAFGRWRTRKTSLSRSRFILEVDVLILILIIDIEHVLDIVGRLRRGFAHDLRILLLELSQCQLAIGTVLVEVARRPSSSEGNADVGEALTYATRSILLH